MESKKIAIFGAGLVGSLQALFMRKLGHEVHIYERRSDPRKLSAGEGRSINLIITSRGIEALKHVDLVDQVLNLTVPVYGRKMHDLEGNLTYQPYGKKEECNYSVSRLLLNQELISFAEERGAHFHFSSGLESLDLENSSAQLSSNERVTFDHAFGTDGAGSVARDELMKISGGESSTEFLANNYKEFLMPADSSGKYLIDESSLHIWPRGHHFLMALPNLKGSFTMTLYLDPTGPVSFEQIQTKEGIEKYFNQYYPDVPPLIPNYVEQLLENPEGKLGTVRCAPWVYRDKIALLGDSAHAITPFFGQGMNAGFEDCSVLFKLLRDNPQAWEKAFSEYDKTQKPNGDAIADMALENYVEMCDKVGDPNFLLKKKVEAELIERFPDKYNSRYRMVVYGLGSYKEALDQGIKNKEILNQLVQGKNSLEEIDWGYAEELLS